MLSTRSERLFAIVCFVWAVCLSVSAQTVRTSSCYDYNLTGQLLTDGIIETEPPVFLEVFADGRLLPRREREWAIGGNDWCNNVVERSLRYRWHGMAVKADQVRVVCYVQHQADIACKGATITLKADGHKVRKRFEGLPGIARGTSQHSDPNKRVEGVRLPTRRVEVAFDLGTGTTLTDMSFLFDMKGAECWRVNTIEFLREGRVVDDVLPSMHFSSYWMSDIAPDKHHEVVIEGATGTPVLHWLKGYEPKRYDIKQEEGRLRITMDGREQVALTEMEGLSLHGASGVSDWLISRHDTLHWQPAVVPGSALTSYNPSDPSESFFNSDFWYRGVLARPDGDGGRFILNFDGVNWKAEVYFNGHYVGRIDGAFKRGRFDVTELVEDRNVALVRILPNVHPGAVKVKTLQSSDFNGGVLGADNPTFHSNVGWDWIPTVPGRNIGIWNDVYITREGDVSLLDPVVTTTLDDSLRASMTPAVRLVNNTGHAVFGRLTGTIGELTFSRPITLEAGQTREASFSPDDYPQLRGQDMRLWWPNGMGEPHLYDATFCFEGDTLRYKAGIREVTYDSAHTRLQLFVNRCRVNPLGGNWGFPEENLRYTAREYDIAVRLHKEMNFNMIRNWVGQTGDKEFYEACDKYGILVWQDFWLANPADGPNPTDESMFMDNACDYVYRIRQHPCVALYCGRNEGYPPASLDSALRVCVAKEHPGLCYISSSADEGVSGHGPYWAVPRQEYFDNQTGKLHTERGMPNIMNIESLRRCLDEKSLWPQSDAWGKLDFVLEGAQRGATFNKLIENYGHPTDAASFCRIAQWQNYEGHRAMFEASNVQRQGLLMWMSHPCHPSMTWQTYDYFFDTPASFYAIKKACEPLHVQFDSHRKRVQVVAQPSCERGTLLARALIVSRDGVVESHCSERVAVAPDTTVDVLSHLQLPADSVTRFLRLQLIDNDTRIVSDNTYLYNAHGDDYTDLTASMPATTVEVKMGSGHVLVRNTGNAPALLVRLKLVGEDGEMVLPAYFSDNYFHLMPGEQRVVVVDCDNASAARVEAEF